MMMMKLLISLPFKQVVCPPNELGQTAATAAVSTSSVGSGKYLKSRFSGCTSKLEIEIGFQGKLKRNHENMMIRKCKFIQTRNC